MKTPMVSYMFLLIFMSGAVNAQWTAQTSATTRDLHGVFFTDVNTGWSVGVNGTIVKTSNGGLLWSTQTSGTTANLASVFFSSLTSGWVVGAGGIIQHTANGGTTWTAQTSGIANNLNSVYFVSSTNGWAVGDNGKILVTTNGGITWTAQTSGTTKNLTDVQFTDANNGWAVGQTGTILHTTNGGITWTAQSSTTTTDLTAVNFINATTGRAVGQNGTILKTTNGGVTWTPEASGTTNDLNDIQFVSSTMGWALGKNGVVLATTDGGVTWNAQTGANNKDINGVFFVNGGGGTTSGWAVSNNGNIQTLTVAILPVKFTYFDALSPGCGTGRLTWGTANETNNSGFTVEWSDNGFHWLPIGIVAGRVTSNATPAYSFTYDFLSAGNNFFRLKQTDFDGDVAYSLIVLLNNNCTVSRKATLFPNPTAGPVIFRTDDTRLIGSKMILTSLSGQLLQNILLAKSEQTIDLSGLPPAMYLLTTASGQSLKILKQ